VRGIEVKTAYERLSGRERDRETNRVKDTPSVPEFISPEEKA
jgi:hypothetical protein